MSFSTNKKRFGALGYYILGTFGDKNAERKPCTYDVILTLFKSADWISTSAESDVKVVSYVQRLPLTFLPPKSLLIPTHLRKSAINGQLVNPGAGRHSEGS